MKAAALSDNSGTVAFYPRLVLTQDQTGSQTVFFCEYGDGSTGTAAATLTKQPKSASPAYQAVPLNIGGTADCLPGPPGPGGDVATISLPVGHYNVYSTFYFAVNGTVVFVPGD